MGETGHEEVIGELRALSPRSPYLGQVSICLYNHPTCSPDFILIKAVDRFDYPPTFFSTLHQYSLHHHGSAPRRKGRSL
jgi:hypothetical protein